MRLVTSSGLIVPLAIGLGFGISCGGGGGSSDTESLPADIDKYEVLKCRDRDTDDVRYFCVKVGDCPGINYAGLCAHNWFGPATPPGMPTHEDPKFYNRFNPFEGDGFAVWTREECGSSCTSIGDGPEPEPGSSIPACEEPYTGACHGDPPGGSSSTTEMNPTGTPTEGTTTELNPTSTTGTTGGELKTWVCTTQAHQICQDRCGSASWADDEHCWKPDSNAAPCVTAFNETDAKDACDCLCAKQNDVYLNGCPEAQSCPPGAVCNVLESMNCDVQPVEWNPMNIACLLPIPDAIDDVLPCSSNNYKVFDASFSVILADGTTTAAVGVSGYLRYTVSGCGGGTCNFRVDVLSLPAETLYGSYLQGSTVGNYVLEKLRVDMTAPLEGTWIHGRETIVFNGNEFWADAKLTNMSLDSNAMTVLSPLTFGTNQVVGSLDTAMSVLTLNFAFEVPGGMATMSLTTH